MAGKFMKIKYIRNNQVWVKQQNRINKLLEKSYDDLSIQEKLELAYDKYFKKEKISYSEYEMMLMTNDEIEFIYKNEEYQVIHESPTCTTMCIISYGNKEPIIRCINYSSTIELLELFRIEGKSIIEIWDEVTF